MKKQNVNLEDYKNSEIMKGFKDKPLSIEETINSNFEKGLIDEDLFHKAMDDLDLVKAGKRAVIGEIRNRAGGKYRKTTDGWEKVTEGNKNTQVATLNHPEHGKLTFSHSIEEGSKGKTTYTFHNEKGDKVELHNKEFEDLKEGNKEKFKKEDDSKNSSVNVGDLVTYEGKQYILHSKDKSSKTVYLQNLNGKLAEDSKGSALQVHETRVKKHDKTPDIEDLKAGLSSAKLMKEDEKDTGFDGKLRNKKEMISYLESEIEKFNSKNNDKN